MNNQKSLFLFFTSLYDKKLFFCDTKKLYYIILSMVKVLKNKTYKWRRKF